MSVLLVLITLLALPDAQEPADLEQLTLHYMHSIEQGEEIAPSVWALARMYHAADSANQTRILLNISSTEIRDGLRESTHPSTTVIRLNRHFRDEQLLLYSLLTTAGESDRQSLFSRFYEQEVSRELIDLNRHAVSGEPIPYDLLPMDSFSFEHFLVHYYFPHFVFFNEQFYENYARHWNSHWKSNTPSTLLEELHLVTVINGLYKTRDFTSLRYLYSPVISLSFLPPSVLTINLYWDFEFAMSQIGLYSISLEVMRDKLLPLSTYLNYRINRIFTTYGGYLYILGRYQDSKDVFLSLLDKSNSLSDNDLTRIYHNLSLIYFETGNSSRYIETQMKALELAQSTSQSNIQLLIYRNLHHFYLKNRNFELARRYLDLSEDIALQLDSADELISTLTFRAEFSYNTDGAASQSIAYLRQADDLLHDETDVRTYTRVKFELANYYKLAGELERSKEVLQEVLTEKSADLIVPVYLEIQLEMAWLELQTGNHTEARQRLREFHAHDISVVPFPVLVMAKTVEAKLYEFDGLHRQAEAAYAEAAERTFERTQNSADRESGYWTAEPEYLALFESYVNFLMGQRKYTDAIHILDQVKTINDAAITDNRLVVADRLTEEQLSRKAQIDQEMDRIRRQLFAASSANRLQLKTELEQLAAERNQILAGVSSAMRQQPPPVWALQNRLAADELVLHITEINNTYYIASIRKNEITLQKKEISSEVKEQLDGAVQSLVRGQANLHNLYSASQFLGIPELDPAIRSIIVFPDGHFHQLPLDVLPVQPPASAVSYGSASFLIEQADVRALNRLADLHRTNRASGFEHNFTGFGVSDFHNQQTNRDLMTLPNAPVEVHTITEALTRLNHKRVVVEQDATPSAFKELASGSRILHMASHSEVSESDPLFSRLHFSADPGFEGDPFLFAYELFDLNLQNDLIMLNSCESGSGRFLQGSGIMGISRALRYAGASSLVLNAWSVNDQLAAEFATLFYGYLNDGMTKSKALQQTKVDFIRTKNANPHFWGPYILNGDNAPLVPRPDVQIANIGMLFLFILGAVFVAVRRQRFH